MGFKLREVREAKGMSQEELEKASGISRQTISSIENAKSTSVMSGTLVALARALGVTVDEIFFDDSVNSIKR